MDELREEDRRERKFLFSHPYLLPWLHILLLVILDYEAANGAGRAVRAMKGPTILSGTFFSLMIGVESLIWAFLLRSKRKLFLRLMASAFLAFLPLLGLYYLRLQ